MAKKGSKKQPTWSNTADFDNAPNATAALVEKTTTPAITTTSQRDDNHAPAKT